MPYDKCSTFSGRIYTLENRIRMYANAIKLLEGSLERNPGHQGTMMDLEMFRRDKQRFEAELLQATIDLMACREGRDVDVHGVS